MPCVFSVDVEDWFHILDVNSAPNIAEWSRIPSRVERNFGRLLDLFAEDGKSVTCFFLGWIADRYPHLVRSAMRAGHEIASHGYAHQLVYTMRPEAFQQDIYRAKALLEDISGRRVLGYRAPGFSVTTATPWFFDELAAAGYRYDASVFPAKRNHGGLPGAPLTPFRVGSLLEFPISVQPICSVPVCFFGGGYLRLFPYQVIQRMAHAVLHAGAPVNFYIHPREIDPDQPRLKLNFARRFKTYVNISSTETKLHQVLKHFEFVKFDALYAEYSREVRQDVASQGVAVA